MIISYEVENYLSFLRPSPVDMTVGATVPDNYHFVPADGSRVTKIVGIYGANASGKTNLLRVLPALSAFVAESFNKPLESELPFAPHFFNRDAPVKIHVEFQVPQDGSRYRYAVEVLGKRVLSESLKRKTSKLFSRVFERYWEGNTYKVIGLGERHASNLRENVSWLSWLAQYNVPEALEIVRYFKGISSNMIGSNLRKQSFFGTLMATEFFRQSPVHTARMIKQLNRWDIDINDICFEKVPLAGNDSIEGPWMAYSIHKRGDKVVQLPMVEESSGTNGLFSILSIVMPALDDGGVVIIDELETDLHPHMVEVLLDLFVQPDSNPKNAQLIFASHADWLMNLLHKTQIVLVDKTEEGSEAFRLSDLKGVQARENYSARYRSGAYGGVPEFN
jgi:uncharacterized protein